MSLNLLLPYQDFSIIYFDPTHSILLGQNEINPCATFPVILILFFTQIKKSLEEIRVHITLSSHLRLHLNNNTDDFRKCCVLQILSGCLGNY